MKRHIKEPIEILRRDFLRLLSGGVVSLATGNLLAGCGGGGNGGGSANPVVFTKVQPVNAGAGTISDTTRGIQLTIPANTFSGPSNVTLTVHANPNSNAAPKGFTTNQNDVDLAVDPNSLSNQGMLSLQIPWTAPYTTLGTAVYLSNSQGVVLPLAVSYDASHNILTATITKNDLLAVAEGTSGSQAYSLFVSNANISNTGRAATSAPARNVGEPRVTSRAAGNQRVAIVIHGLFDTPAGIAPIVSYLQSTNFNLPVDPSGTGDSNGQGATGKVYDVVTTFGYNYYNPISTNGVGLAQVITSNYANADVVDLYAHSMGGLVSRWAIEQAGLGGKINQLVTLGTPHTGVPLGGLQLLLRFLFPAVAGTSTVAAPGMFDLIQGSDFLNTLNAGASGTSATAYRTVAGTSYTNFYGGLGVAVNLLYQVLSPLTHVVHDGIVPANSALAVGNASHSYSLNHTQLVTNIATGSAGKGLIDDWVVTSFTGTVQ